jgi:hypothetical protein
MKASYQEGGGMGGFCGPKPVLKGSVITIYQGRQLSEDDVKRLTKEQGRYVAGAQNGTGIKILGLTPDQMAACAGKGHSCGGASCCNAAKKASDVNVVYVDHSYLFSL